MAKLGIYQLSEFQYTQLIESTNGEHAVFALLETNDRDTLERREKIQRHIRDMEDLIDLGFMRDVSDAFKNQIEQSAAVNNRRYRVLVPTENGLLMFGNSENRPVN